MSSQSLKIKLGFILFVLFSFKLNAQSNLQFDKRYVECEDRWVAFKMNKDSTYTFGFIYIDEQAGLTIQVEGHFRYKQDQTIVLEKSKNSNMKIRLQPNAVQVALIPEAMFSSLNIVAVPEWLHFYKPDTLSAQRLYKWGYLYNGWNECSKALGFLLQARKLNPKFEGLNVELAFSYNCLDKYDSAEIILAEDVKLYPSNAYINKEYIYTLVKAKKIDKAIQQYNATLKLLKDQSFNSENCYNILQYYYVQKDKKNFDLWCKELKKWPLENEQIQFYIDKMKKELEK